jgi:hypothetical protein
MFTVAYEGAYKLIKSAHDLFGEPVSIPDQVRGRLSPDHALPDFACSWARERRIRTREIRIDSSSQALEE